MTHGHELWGVGDAGGSGGSFSFILGNVIMMCLEVCFLVSSFFGTLWAFWTSWKPISFARLGKFSFIICSNKFSISCSSSSPSGTPMIWILERLKLFGRFLSLSSFFLILVSSFHSGQMFISSFCSKLLIWVPVSFLSLLVPCISFFISLCLAFTSSSILWHTQPFLWESWLSVFWTLHLIGWVSLHHLVAFFGALICFSFGPYFFVSAHLLCCKGWSLRYLPGQGNPLGWVVALFVEEGSEREWCCLLGSWPAFSHFHHYPQANCATLVLIPGWVGLCTF